jgi:4-amino-4-deoxy-L-arabinose transferase-like glycosyltransferase
MVFNVQTWLATDALLLASVALALLGMHIGVTARGDLRQLWGGFGLMHLGLLLALFTKNFAGWLVPVSTLITYMILERRLRELWHPSVWLPGIGTLALLIFWGRIVAAAPQGNGSIHQLFWNNLAGRMAAYISPSGAVLDLGHRNWPGKYLIELPLYLLPWTPLAIGAVIRLWRERRIRSAADAGRRFALCATVPALVILSLAATARGTYAAPLLVGVALLIALALTAQPEDPDLAAASQRLMARAFRWSAWLILLIDGTLLLGIDVVTVRRNEVAGVAVWVALSGVAAVIALGGACLRDTAQRDPPIAQSLSVLRRLTLTHLGGLIAIAIMALPLLNRWQDLVEVADHIEKIAAGRPLILWLPDETTLAMSDLYMRPPSCVVRSDDENRAHRQDELDSCLRRYPDAVVVGMQFCTDCKIMRSLLSAADPLQPRRVPLTDPDLLAAGFHPDLGVIRPGGRTYLVSIRGP